MSHLSQDQLEQLFKAGQACGRGARATLPQGVLFSDEQRAWLQGFLIALLESSSDSCGATGARQTESSLLQQEHRSMAPGLTRRSTPEDALPRHSRVNPFAARITEVTSVSSGPDRVLRFVLDVEGSDLAFDPCSTLGVAPQNAPDLVRQLLRTLGARGQEVVDSPRGANPLWRVLLEELEIRRPSKALVELLAEVARAGDERDHLRQMVDASAPCELTVQGLLRRFPSARPRPRDFAQALHPLVPSFYPVVAFATSGPETVEALTVLDERPNAGFGAASPFVRENLEVGRWLPIFAAPAETALPDDPDAAVVVFTCGITVARARCFLDYRSGTGARGRNWVFSDTRWFDSEFTGWQRSGRLTRWHSTSVPGPDALMELIEAQGATLWSWIIDKSILCACGSEPEVAKIAEALQRLAVNEGRMSADAAKEWMAGLLRAGSFRPFLVPEP